MSALAVCLVSLDIDPLIQNSKSLTCVKDALGVCDSYENCLCEELEVIIVW